MSEKKCFLCGQQASVQYSLDRGVRDNVVDCSRFGRYVLAEFVNSHVRDLAPEERAWLSIHTRTNPGTKFLTLPGAGEVPEHVAIINRLKAMTAMDRAEKALEEIARRAGRPFVAVVLASDDEPVLYALDKGDLEGLLKYLLEQEWISVHSFETGWQVSLTALGEAQVKEKEKGSLGFKPHR
jgi:hypothetical protein